MAHNDVQHAVVKRIKQLCRSRKWTSYKLAMEAGLPYSSIKDIFAGRTKNISIKIIKIICDAFDISLIEFFSTSDFEKLEQEIK